MTAVTNNIDCVTLKRAYLILPLDNATEATTDPPIPAISPNPVNSIKIGMQMLIAAIPCAPMPCPTNTPSIAVTAHMLNIPAKVGKNNFPNKTEIFSLPKFIFLSFPLT